MISIQTSLADLGMKAAAALINGVDNTQSCGNLSEKLRARARAVCAAFPPDGPRGLPEVLTLQSVYQKLNVSWRKNRPSIERLSVMLTKNKPLPIINPVVDIYNVASLEAMMCMGAHDLHHISLPISLRTTGGGEVFKAMNGDEEVLPAGEFAYFDAADRIICRLDAIQGDVSKVGPETRDVLLIVEGSPATTMSKIIETVKTTAEEIALATGGTIAEMAIAKPI